MKSDEKNTHLDFKEVKQCAVGRWPGIFVQFGVDVGEGKHQPCPMCEGKDRFRFDDKDGNGTYFCNQCGAGDGWSLVQKYFNIDFIESIRKVAQVVGVVEKTKTETKPKYGSVKMLNDLWKESKPLVGSDPVSLYLHSRKLVLTPDDVRYCEDCYESDTKAGFKAMIAMVRNVNGKGVTLHRTYLKDGKQADISSPKKLMPGKEQLNGSAIRLFEPKENRIGIAEGIETAIACYQIFDVPTWAVVSSSLMESFEPPEGIREVVIYGDADANFTGHKAAYVLANKLFLKDYLISVVIPKSGDWADSMVEQAE